MAETINISCPGCKAKFVVPVEFCGKTAECANCSETFEIPSVKDIQNKIDAGLVENLNETKDNDTHYTCTDTNTVKLFRSGRKNGMIPKIE